MWFPEALIVDSRVFNSSCEKWATYFCGIRHSFESPKLALKGLPPVESSTSPPLSFEPLATARSFNWEPTTLCLTFSVDSKSIFSALIRRCSSLQLWGIPRWISLRQKLQIFRVAGGWGASCCAGRPKPPATTRRPWFCCTWASLLCSACCASFNRAVSQTLHRHCTQVLVNGCGGFFVV